jgi:hypothetical protein
MRVIDDKNETIGELEGQARGNEGMLAELKKRLGEAQTQAETYLSQITTMKLERERALDENNQHWQAKLEELHQVIGSIAQQGPQ